MNIHLITVLIKLFTNYNFTMKDFIIMCMLYGVIGGLMGTAWTQVIRPYMIFSFIGLWIQRAGSYSRFGRTRFIPTKSQMRQIDGVAKKWDQKLPLHRKLLQGLGCIYCVSTWFTILTYLYVLIFRTDLNSYPIFYHFIGLVSAIGINMLIAEIVVILRSINHSINLKKSTP